MSTRLYFVHALSSLHAGTGQGSGVIDLPIAREKATGLPYLPGSSVKGVLRDRSGDDPLTYALFGPKTENASDHAGSLQLADARLLLLPVRSLRGTFAWVTSPYVLRRFARDAADAKQRDTPPKKSDASDAKQGGTPPKQSGIPPKQGGKSKSQINLRQGYAPQGGIPSTWGDTPHARQSDTPPTPTLTDEQCDVTETTKLTIQLRNQNGVVLEDLDLIQHRKQATAWATWLNDKLFPTDDEIWPTLITERLCIVSDDVLNFLLSTAIEVIARNRLDDATKTVAKGALWYEEALPAETVLYGLATFSPTRTVRNNHNDTVLVEKLNELANGTMQFGGKATIGRGLCRLRLLEEG